MRSGEHEPWRRGAPHVRPHRDDAEAAPHQDDAEASRPAARSTPEPVPTVIALTPVRNEAWILDRFLAAASTWADHLVVADQHSDDGSAETARAHPRTTVVPNDAPGYDEAARQRLLIETARALPAPGRRVFLALDADEMLSANWTDSPEWQSILDAPPGTVVCLRWANLLPGLGTCWLSDFIPFGFVDDGSAHAGDAIHSRRLPTPPEAPRLLLHDVVVLHFQYIDWARMRSKQRWYQAWEVLHHAHSDAVTRYRLYHAMDTEASRPVPVRPEWLAGYAERGIDLTSLRPETPYRWDAEVAAWLAEHGPRCFRRCAIWDHDWGTPDPRTPLDRLAFAWLRATQPHRDRLGVRAGDALLKRIWT